MKKRVGVVFGTRPDVIKMAPVVLELRKFPSRYDPVVISTGQHRQMLDQVFQVFDVSADIELDLMRHNQTLNDLTRRILGAMDGLLAQPALSCKRPPERPRRRLSCPLARADNRVGFRHRLEKAHQNGNWRAIGPVSKPPISHTKVTAQF